MKYINVISAIEEIAPPNLAEEWDNSGIQVNPGVIDIKKILVCMEISKEIIEEAKQNFVDMIITHHPLIFTPKKNIDVDTVEGSYITELIKSNIAVYSAHLSFDNAEFGNGYYLAQLLGLKKLKRIEERNPLIFGELSEELTFNEFLKKIKKDFKLESKFLKGVPRTDELIKKVSICPGSGGDFLELAIENGAEALITGDLKLHQGKMAQANNFALIDAGHYGTEKFFVDNFSKQLAKKLNEEVQIINTSINEEPFV